MTEFLMISTCHQFELFISPCFFQKSSHNAGGESNQRKACVLAVLNLTNNAT